ncbi:hypothetical protein SAMN04487851_10241 [Prevotella sp. tc2-28]|uniref:hypothetical protein n=1 Tax=Prevotella sp. tc2-28 TaxID=1761888 RepID=UPI00089ADB64|nr:hypothetical protein [Prevotella sp. tc2-28]SEA02759.1 hypothetical protein SAMN04487851_10241 [Prevotella sp. tc2-28]
MVDYKNILTGVAERLSSLREERPSAGTRYRLMGVLADIMEAVEMLSKEVLDRVSQEAVLDADVDADFDVMSEEVLSWELTIKNDDLQELTQQVNDALGGLSNVLSQIGSQLSRHHSNEEYARLYEQEKRRYLGSKTAKSARKTFDEWKEDQCYGTPSLEDIVDYALEKLVHMFNKGVFSARVEHIQRTTRYPGEFDFEQLDVDTESRKLIYKNYAVLRKLVDYTDGFLVVNAARVGQHFYASRREEKAKANRTNFLKYMHKITLAQEEYKKLQDAQQESEDSSLLPDVLATGMAMKYWKRLQKAGFVDEHYQLSPTTTRKQAMYIADVFSDKLQMRSKWKPFQELWHINNLAQEKWEMQETGKSPARSEEIDKIFED